MSEWVYSVAAWTVGWAAVHSVSGEIPITLSSLLGYKPFSERLRRCYGGIEDDKKAYWRRLIRSQFYYFMAGVWGIQLLYTEYPIVAYFSGPDRGPGDTVQKGNSVEALLNHWSPTIEVSANLIPCSACC